MLEICAGKAMLGYQADGGASGEQEKRYPGVLEEGQAKQNRKRLTSKCYK